MNALAPAAGEPLDELLAQYAAGTLSRPMHVLVRAHLELAGTHRAFVAGLEGAAARAIETGDALPLLARPADRDARLAAIFASDAPAALPRRTAMADERGLPPALRDYIGRDMDDVAWKTWFPGFKEYRVEESDGGYASLLRIGAGRAMPAHTHDGLEATLVLRGSFSDAEGVFRRGDIEVGDGGLDHRPVAGTEEDCICFIVTEAPPRLTGPIGRYLDRFIRR